MKKTNMSFNYCCLILIVLFSSCSQMKYAHLNKIKVDEQLVLNELVKMDKQEKEAIVLSSNEKSVPTVVKDVCAEDEIFSDAKVESKSNKDQVNSQTIAKHLKNPKTEALALKVISKLPNKLKAAFAEKKNIASFENKNDRNNVIWIVIVVLLVLFLLGLLKGGSIGGLIYLLLAIALVLIILRLLGVL